MGSSNPRQILAIGSRKIVTGCWLKTVFQIGHVTLGGGLGGAVDLAPFVEEPTETNDFGAYGRRVLNRKSRSPPERVTQGGLDRVAREWRISSLRVAEGAVVPPSAYEWGTQHTCGQGRACRPRRTYSYPGGTCRA